ncbi:MAG: hypothetical protein IJW86_10190 [Clostridia bacterium]|nr:hypothetical protein [Clostridia bacterium]
MEKITAQNADRSLLKDINDVVIDTSQPCNDRVRNYVKQIGNPYCYLDNGVVVEIGYADTQVSLRERLLSYASNIDKGSGNLW